MVRFYNVQFTINKDCAQLGLFSNPSLHPSILISDMLYRILVLAYLASTLSRFECTSSDFYNETLNANLPLNHFSYLLSDNREKFPFFLTKDTSVPNSGEFYLNDVKLSCPAFNVFDGEKCVPSLGGRHAVVQDDPKKRFVCYASNWYIYKSPSFDIRRLPVDVCTHVIYAFFPLTDQYKIAYSDCWGDKGKQQMANVVKLRNQGMVKKIMLSIGGWTYSGDNLGSVFPVCYDGNQGPTVNTKSYQTLWDEMLQSETHRKTFIGSILALVRTEGFDGVEIDYEYPGCPQGVCQDRYQHQQANFVTFLQELRAAAPPGFVLSTALGATPEKMGNDLNGMLAELDFVNLMSYDYYGYGYSDELSKHNQPKDKIKETLDYLMSKNVNMSSVNVGISLYGRGYAVSKADYARAYETGDPSQANMIGPSDSFPIAYEPSVITNVDMCLSEMNFCSVGDLSGSGAKVKSPGCQCCDCCGEDAPAPAPVPTCTFSMVHQNNSYLMYKGNQIISYTDVNDLNAIVDIMDNYGIGGVLYYSTDQDDYTGKCKSTYTNYRMVRTMFDLVNKKQVLRENYIITKK